MMRRLMLTAAVAAGLVALGACQPAASEGDTGMAETNAPTEGSAMQAEATQGTGSDTAMSGDAMSSDAAMSGDAMAPSSGSGDAMAAGDGTMAGSDHMQEGSAPAGH